MVSRLWREERAFLRSKKSRWDFLRSEKNIPKCFLSKVIYNKLFLLSLNQCIPAKRGFL